MAIIRDYGGCVPIADIHLFLSYPCKATEDKHS